MRPSQSLVRLALCLTTFGSVASAMEWPRWLPDVDALVVRADSSETQTSATDTGKQTGSTPTPSGTGSNTAGGKDPNTAEPTQSGGAKKTGSRTGSSSTASKTFAPDLPAGGINMLTPATSIQPSVLYKISDNVTWSWNYTSLLGTPTAIDILVSCSAASETWTLAGNQSFATNASYVWDTGKQANDPNQPLGNNMYTLLIKDSDADITAPPQAGYLAASPGFTFAMYTGQPYTQFPDWTCPGSCSFAASTFDRQAVNLAIIMSTLTILGFTWFVSGLGLL